MDAIVNILITIDEGRLFELASISFIRIEKEKAEESRKLFSLQDGKAYHPGKIEDGIRKINETKEFYFVDKDRNVEVGINEESNDIYFVIKVKEIN